MTPYHQLYLRFFFGNEVAQSVKTMIHVKGIPQLENVLDYVFILRLVLEMHGIRYISYFASYKNSFRISYGGSRPRFLLVDHNSS